MKCDRLSLASSRQGTGSTPASTALMSADIWSSNGGGSIFSRSSPFLALVLAGVPAAVAVNYCLEQSFARKWMRRMPPVPTSASVRAAVAGEAVL